MADSHSAAQHTATYQKLAKVITQSPKDKTALHSDPIIGKIIKKLSTADVATLSEVVNKQTACDCNPQPNG
jgi:hypothetical protein